MTTSMTESRFNMWRAVIAMAHADGVVTGDERDLVEKYIGKLPLSEGQKVTLRADLQQEQDVNAMLAAVSEPSDQADFFQFAQMIVNVDGDRAQQEQAIVEKLTSKQMSKFSKEEITQNLRQGRMAAQFRLATEEEAFDEQAKNTQVRWSGSERRKRDRGGLSSTVKWMQQQSFQKPSPDLFTLWRAVFSLANADGKISQQESEYIEGMMWIFKFSPGQRRAVEDDLQSKDSIMPLFRELRDVGRPDLLGQYFRAARSIMWSDWDFTAEERETMKSLIALLTPAEKEALAKDIAWAEEPPQQAEPAAEEAPPEEERQAEGMKGLFVRMLDFYNRAARP